MVTEEQLEAVIKDFIYECEKQNETSDSCGECMYYDFCARFYTPHCDCPDEWTIYEKVSKIPS